MQQQSETNIVKIEKILKEDFIKNKEDEMAFKDAFNHTYEEFLGNKSKTKDCILDTKKTEVEQYGDYMLLQKWIKSVINGDGPLERVYIGNVDRRLYCTDSIQGIPGAYKGYLIGKYATDIDMVNAHPTLLRYICEKNGVAMPLLDYYVKNRTEVLKWNQDAKKIVISYINGCKFTMPKESNCFFNNFKKECKENVHNKLIKMDKYSYLFKQVKKEENVDGSVTFRIMEALEVEIVLNVFLPFLESKNIKPAVLMHDGVMVYGNYYEDPSLLEELQIAVEKVYPGLGLKFSYKKHSETIKRELNFEQVEKKYQELCKNECITDRNVAEKIIDQNRSNFFRVGENIFVKRDNIWHCSELSLKTAFDRWIADSELIHIQNQKVKIKISDTPKKWNDYCRIIKSIVMATKEDNEKMLSLDRQKDVLPFDDGYYDFKMRKFVHYNDPNAKEIFFTSKINFPIFDVDKIDEECLEKVDEIFCETFNISTKELNEHKTLKDEYLAFCCRSLSGHVEDKNWTSATGLRNSGKSLIEAFFQDCFDSMIGMIDSDELLVKKNSCESSERSNGFCLNICEKRLCFSSECATTGVFDSKKMKSVVSGGDKITYRSAYGKAFTRNVACLLIIQSQSLPKCSSNDAKDNLLSFTMPCQFKDDIDEGEVKSGFVIKKADPNIKNILKNNKSMREAMTFYILSHYQEEKPKYELSRANTMEDREQNEEEKDDLSEMRRIFEENFTYNSEASKKIMTKSSEIMRILKDKIPTVTPQKIKNFITSNYGDVYKRSNGFTGYLKISRKTIQVEEASKSSVF